MQAGIEAIPLVSGPYLALIRLVEKNVNYISTPTSQEKEGMLQTLGTWRKLHDKGAE
jgi:hypothetical protein